MRKIVILPLLLSMFAAGLFNPASVSAEPMNEERFRERMFTVEVRSYIQEDPLPRMHALGLVNTLNRDDLLVLQRAMDHVFPSILRPATFKPTPFPIIFSEAIDAALMRLDYNPAAPKDKAFVRMLLLNYAYGLGPGDAFVRERLAEMSPPEMENLRRDLAKMIQEDGREFSARAGFRTYSAPEIYAANVLDWFLEGRLGGFSYDLVLEGRFTKLDSHLERNLEGGVIFTYTFETRSGQVYEKVSPGCRTLASPRYGYILNFQDTVRIYVGVLTSRYGEELLGRYVHKMELLSE